MIKSNTNFNLYPLLKNITGNKILDYQLRTRIDEKYIPQIFNNKIVFQSYNSFQQNNFTLGKKIRQFVINNIKSSLINAIGGESYLYGNLKSLFYTNSHSIYNDAKYNQYKNIKIIDYNKDKISLKSFDTVINLSKLNINLIEQINNSISNRLIIINCHHLDFWKKIKLLENYKLIKREKFIEYKSKYFVTVNILIRKSFVSFGSNCAVTYQLNKYNLRNKAYPFDWCKIKLPQLIKIYKNDFNNYHLIECNKYSKNHNSYILKNKYCIFAHELIKNNIMEENNQIEINNQIEMFKIKLLERINRIKNIKNPVFVRIETYNYRSKEIYINYWKQLLLLLDNYYSSYLIILISKFNPKLNNIRWYSHNKFNKNWKNENIDWFNIFVNN
jgi:hypothetical protein